jgi:Domain of unknown function (DUF4136)
MKLMRMLLPLPLLALSLLAQDVRYNFSSGTNFERFKTYKWVLIKGADQPDQLTDQQIKSAIDAELSKKGLTKTVGETPDLLIAYQVSLAQEKQTTMYDSGWAYGPGWRYGYGGYGGGITTATTSTIQIGQIDLDFYDPTGKQLVWRGTASKTLDVKASPEKRQKNLAKGVAKLLKNFPPPKKG